MFTLKNSIKSYVGSTYFFVQFSRKNDLIDVRSCKIFWIEQIGKCLKNRLVHTQAGFQLKLLDLEQQPRNN